jgi:NAD(P)-dependent dehydrogenase (short-subunit alcohol dehydrogenase family)
MERRWTTADVPDQAGRTAVVTGGNTGLGYQVALTLAQRGATVVLACRDVRTATDAALRIAAATSGERKAVGVVRLDLASLESVRAAAGELGERFETIDLLVNNAGVMMTPFGLTRDGFELQFGTNHLGPFAFTGLLMDRIEARVVTVSSLVHARGQLDLRNLGNPERYGRSAAYAGSKLSNLLFAYELDRRLRAAGSQVRSLAAHPGYANTGLARHLTPPVQFGSRLAGQLIGQDAEHGAQPMLRAATDPEAGGGEFYGPSGPWHFKGNPVRLRSSARSYDLELAGELWAESERLTGVRYPLT